MNIKEKAKAYDEAEGEKIRKALLEMVHDTTGDELWIDYDVHKEDALAWLEKQGEQKPAQNYVYLVYCRDENNDYFCGNIIASDKEECIKLFRKNVGNYKFTATRLFKTSLPSGIPFLNEPFEKFTIQEC